VRILLLVHVKNAKVLTIQKQSLSYPEKRFNFADNSTPLI